MSQSPVTEGEFSTGPEWMLWRPGLNRRRLRWRAARPSAARTIAVALVGAGSAVLAMHDSAESLAWLLIILTVVLTGASVVSTVVDYDCADFDHQHSPNRPCFLEHAPGVFFYRARDFRALPPSVVGSVSAIIAAVDRVHISKAAVWLDAQHLRDVHAVAWDLLSILDQTRTLREAIATPRCAEFAELGEARTYLISVDTAVDHVLSCLRQVELLTTSWEQKLAEIDLRARLRATLGLPPLNAVDATISKAQDLPESMFACITAARDLTDAGLFDWERRPHPSGGAPAEQPGLALKGVAR